MRRFSSSGGLLAVFAVVAACTSTPNGAGDGGDAGVDAGPDAGNVGLICSQLLNCDQPCPTSACTDHCYATSTAVAQGLFDAFDNCIAAVCNVDGGPCSGPNGGSSSACSNCNSSTATGVCVANLLSCENDMSVGPPNPDGGAAVPMDAGPELSCGGLIGCVAGCPVVDGGTDVTCAAACNAQGTPTAMALAGALNACLAIACPSTDGGPCETQGLACSGCVEQVELAQPNTCAAPYVACNTDTSNSPDGGATPTVLVDGGVITSLAIGLDQAASSIVVGGGYLYFTQVLTGTPVLRFPLTDGGPTSFLLDSGVITSVGPPQPTPVALAVDANNVYVWSVGTFALKPSSTNNQDGTVMQIPLDGGAPILLRQNMEVLYDAAYLNAIAVDSKNVYWVEGASGSDGVIRRTPIGGGSSVALYSGQYVPQALTTDGINVYWADWGTFNAQGDPVGDGTVWQGPVDGGTPIMLASNQEAPAAIAVDGTNVYWTNLGHLGGDNLPTPNSGSVMKASIGGGNLTTIATAQAVPVSILVAGGTVYWSEYGLSSPGLILSAPADGGTVTPLLSGLPDPAALAIWGDTLFWTNLNSSPTSGSIFALSPF